MIDMQTIVWSGLQHENTLPFDNKYFTFVFGFFSSGFSFHLYGLRFFFCSRKDLERRLCSSFVLYIGHNYYDSKKLFDDYNGYIFCQNTKHKKKICKDHVRADVLLSL